VRGEGTRRQCLKTYILLLLLWVLIRVRE
jgi:hypothetical protein